MDPQVQVCLRGQRCFKDRSSSQTDLEVNFGSRAYSPGILRNSPSPSMAHMLRYKAGILMGLVSGFCEDQMREYIKTLAW
jgi:hypothetical protein